MISLNIECSCGHLNQVNKLIFNLRRNTGLPYICDECGEDLYKSGRSPKRGKTDSQKRSRQQEKRAAKRIGGRVTAASGATREKGDVRAAGDIRMECKLTRRKSFNLKLAELEKLGRETAPGEDPVFEIEFQGVYPHKRFVVIPGWLYDQFRETNEERDPNN
jgi:hypothetical protein